MTLLQEKLVTLNFALGHLILELNGKRLGEEKILFDYFDKS